MNSQNYITRAACLLLIAAIPSACDQSDPIDPIDDVSLEQIEQLGILSFAPVVDAAAPQHAPMASSIASSSNATPFSYGDVAPSETLVIDWIRWAYNQSLDDGPVADLTGENCAMGQAGPVWQLAGSFGGPVERDCDVPIGKQLFFPLVNRWWGFRHDEDPNRPDIDGYIPWLESYADQYRANTCGLTLQVDGQDLLPNFETMDEALYIRAFDHFTVQLPEGDDWLPYASPEGEIEMVGDGHYARLQPLTPGDHEVVLGGEICGQYPFSTSVLYHLHIGG